MLTASVLTCGLPREVRVLLLIDCKGTSKKAAYKAYCFDLQHMFSASSRALGFATSSCRQPAPFVGWVGVADHSPRPKVASELSILRKYVHREAEQFPWIISNIL